MCENFFCFQAVSKKIFLLISFVIMSACQTQPSIEHSLYQELGGKSAIKDTVRSLVSRLHKDSRLSELFTDVDRLELTTNIESFLCQVSDGGCEYEGASMLDSHAELNITKAEFDHFVTLFIRSMTQARITFSAQNKLLARLAKLRPEIIEL